MNAQSRLRDKQRKWADRAGIHYDEAGYVSCLKDNLFEPLNDEMRSEFEGADGGELGGKRKEGERKKMCALHSSSALCCNVFSYLRTRNLLGVFLDLCGLPAGPIASVHFEGRFRITDKHQPARFPKPANLDLVIEYPPQAATCGRWRWRASSPNRTGGTPVRLGPRILTSPSCGRDSASAARLQPKW